MINIKEKFWRLVRPARNAARKARQRPRVGGIDWGDFDRTRPINANWGYERGTPIDRYYIDRFLREHASDIRGRVLEVAGNEYTEMYGGAGVEVSDILHPVPGNPRATVIADLEEPGRVTEEPYDCIICTQTLQLIFDVNTAIENLYRFLKPGGVLLMSVPGISQICGEDMDIRGDYWRFTSAALQRLLEARFPADAVDVQSHGNVKASIGFLHGIAENEVSQEELLENDPQFQLLLTAVAKKRI